MGRSCLGNSDVLIVSGHAKIFRQLFRGPLLFSMLKLALAIAAAAVATAAPPVDVLICTEAF